MIKASSNTEQQLINLFEKYINAFIEYNIDEAQVCYYLPCTLHTPEQVVYIADSNSFKREFSDIFLTLQQADITDIRVINATYNEVSDNMVLVCIDWQFFTVDKNTQQAQIFTDFTAFYHLGYFAQQWQIFNVVSQELSQSVQLPHPLKIN